MTSTDTCPKQSSVIVMPGRNERRELAQQLQAIAQQLQAIATTLEPTPAAQQILTNPETELQQKLQRRLLRLKAVQAKIQEAVDTLTNLANS